MSRVDLPGIVNIENVKVTVTFLENVFGLFTENCQLELFDKITRTNKLFNGLLFFKQDVCVAIISCKTGSQYYLVDSQARDTEGKLDANGSGVIIKFEGILEFISYITDIYENISARYKMNFSF